MGADTKALKQRMKSVNSTLHLTKAMGLVASSKIRIANRAMQNSVEYADAFQTMIGILSASAECAKSPYLSPRSSARTRLIVIAGDRGLCGGYNAGIFRLAKEYPDAELIPIGKRAYDRYGNQLLSSEHFTSAEAHAFADAQCRDFLDGKFDRLGIISGKYISVLSQIAEVNWILPLSKDPDRPKHSILFEPDEMTILNQIIPEYVTARIMAAVREGFACEVAARRMAMDSAGKNAQQMIDDLTLSYNRARQSSITQEITEIVAGSNL